MNIIILYFSGTGNTQWVAKEIKAKLIDKGHQVSLYNIEDVYDNLHSFDDVNHIIIGFPVYGSTAPYIVQNYIDSILETKKQIPLAVFATHAVASGDSAYYIGKRLKEKGYNLRQTLHFSMPNNFHIPSFKFIKPKNGKVIEKRIRKNDKKISKLINNIIENNYVISTKGVIESFFGNLQRKHIDKVINRINSEIFVDTENCINCNLCLDICPINNISKSGNEYIFSENCNACLRCYSQCPTNSILINKKSSDIIKYPRYKGPKNTFFKRKEHNDDR